MIPTTEQLNAMQDAGLISDLCVTWDDVAPCDKERALRWLGFTPELDLATKPL